MLESSEKYFESYRKKIDEIEFKKDELNVLQQQLSNVRADLLALQSECERMRRIITMMIEKGIDDVEARLRIDEISHRTLWEHDMRIGATGATGPTSNHLTQWSTSVIPNGGYSITAGVTTALSQASVNDFYKTI